MQRKRRWSPLDRRRRWINLQIQSGEQSRESEENRDKAKCKKEKGKKETASGADTRVHALSDAKAYLSSISPLSHPLFTPPLHNLSPYKKNRPMQFSSDIFGVLTDTLSGVLSAGYHSSFFSSSSEFCH
ncbi:hypothetical protein HID58_032809 [Brassica napus]|uniref:Uncharacterized protein n=2 Tax=Brassica TaxID=3705 RepID=A0ABQ8BYM1_BRANA|nr:hypothetical protein HID58_032809 [Brassica napus]